MKQVLALATFILTLSLTGITHAVDEALETQTGIDDSAAASQKLINRLDDETSRNLQRYRVASQRAESLEIYNKQLKRLIDSQVSEIDSITRQTNEIETIETGSLPLMLEMTDTLSELVGAGAPFLTTEREERVANLKSLIDRADVTAGEKFRRIMEAYLVEVDYGRTIEAYRGELQTQGDVRTVDFLRIGRVGLYYQTLDGAESGRWNPATGTWEELPASVRRQIQIGLRIARKQAPPELLALPVNAPESSA
jgi:hypothetical protein